MTLQEAMDIAQVTGKRFRYGSDGKWRRFGVNDSLECSMAMIQSNNWEIEQDPAPQAPLIPPKPTEMMIKRETLLWAINVELGKFYYSCADTSKVAPAIAERLGFKDD